MKLSKLILSTLVILLAGPALYAQDEDQPQEFPGMPVATEQHKILARDAGVWDVELKMYNSGPEADPDIVTGTETNTMIGDFWVSSRLEYEYMGMNVVGMGTFGYDADNDKYMGTWVDSVSPYMSMTVGSYDAETKTMTMHSEMKGPDGMPMKIKMVSVQPDENNKTFTMLMEAGNDAEGNAQYIPFVDMTCKKR